MLIWSAIYISLRDHHEIVSYIANSTHMTTMTTTVLCVCANSPRFHGHVVQQFCGYQWFNISSICVHFIQSNLWFDYYYKCCCSVSMFAEIAQIYSTAVNWQCLDFDINAILDRYSISCLCCSLFIVFYLSASIKIEHTAHLMSGEECKMWCIRKVFTVNKCFVCLPACLPLCISIASIHCNFVISTVCLHNLCCCRGSRWRRRRWWWCYLLNLTYKHNWFDVDTRRALSHAPFSIGQPTKWALWAT